MLTVGLTGNVASGKSSVAAVWRELGATICDADELARRAVAPGSPGLARVVERWGDRVLKESGELDRAAMRDIVFASREDREALEAIVHPIVGALRREAFDAARDAGAAIIVADIPLLFEVGMEDEFDLVALVDAPEGVRRARMLRDRDLDPETADRILASQIPSERKRPLADYIIENRGTLDDLRSAAQRVWQDLERRATGAG